MTGRWRVALLVLVATVAWPSRAGADPPGPTDYRSELVSIEPAAPAVHVGFVGGDSFLEMTVEAGTSVEVTGYRGEPYLRFGVDGVVVENRASPTFHLNGSRYGSALPAGVSVQDPPRWVVVARDGRFAWHDHRTHWMSPFRPPGRAPGDVVLEAVVPITVDGVATSVAVRSVWLPAPSRWPATTGLVAGLVLVAAVVAGRRGWAPVVVIGSAGAAASVIGIARFTAVPTETGPPLVLWVIPAVATLSAIAAVLLRRRHRFVADGLVLLAAMELVVWAWWLRDGIGRAIIPTSLPAALDRTVIVAVAVVGVAVATVQVWTVFRPPPASATTEGT